MASINCYFHSVEWAAYAQHVEQAGADAVYIVSCLYKNGKGYIREMLNTVENWMESKGFASLSDFKGKMSQAKSTDPAIYERVQFMRYFGGKKNVTTR